MSVCVCVCVCVRACTCMCACVCVCKLVRGVFVGVPRQYVQLCGEIEDGVHYVIMKVLGCCIV